MTEERRRAGAILAFKLFRYVAKFNGVDRPVTHPISCASRATCGIGHALELRKLFQLSNLILVYSRRVLIELRRVLIELRRVLIELRRVLIELRRVLIELRKLISRQGRID